MIRNARILRIKYVKFGNFEYEVIIQFILQNLLILQSLMRFKMKFLHSMFIFFICQVKSETISTPYIDRRVEIEECENNIGETITPVSDKIQCVITNAKHRLGSKNDVKIESITYAQLADKGKSTLCKKISTSDNYEIEIKAMQKLKSVVYQVGEEGKALLFGTNTNECYTNLDMTTQELESGYLRVTSIKCFPKEQVEEYQKSSATSKEFREADNRICFLAPMLKKDINLKVKIGEKEYPLTISATPKQECPKCPATDKNSTKSTNTSDSSTHAASTSTTIIVVVVVVIVIVLLCGVGFFMMTK